ncbi:hypothetical protein M513_13078 [Trichuris suis]|uniref:non-specific serine/threonine protein kinase n=1 Tax=Trichuris suis TaxID=68888 RepID=A0A085LM42_9BILA|nr:hypothetical protein M513_13078 [Trichuris suis]
MNAEQQNAADTNSTSENGQSANEGYRTVTYLQKILEVCSQQSVLTWEEAFPGSQLSSWKKVGEGSFSEELCSGLLTLLYVQVIPVQYLHRPYNEVESSGDDIVPEIIISTELSTLSSSTSCWSTPNLLGLYGVQCIKGKYPKELLHAWDQFALNGHTKNDRPEKFTAGQHYVLICTENGGVTLEDFKYRTHEQAISVLKQLVYTLAILEKKYKFEHRDLHLGNILVRRKNKVLKYIIDGKTCYVPSEGVICHLVDYTLSRIQIGDQVVFTDLSSLSWLFNGSRNEQIDVCRSMRDVIGSSWANFNPKTNVLWVAYLVNYFIKAKCRGRELPQVHKRRLLDLKRRIDQCESCEAASLVHDLFSRRKKFPYPSADSSLTVDQ